MMRAGDHHTPSMSSCAGQRLLSLILVIVPASGWPDDSFTPATPLALAYSLAAAEETGLSGYRYALDYRSLSVELDAIVDPLAGEGSRIEIRNSSLAEGVKAERLDSVVADMDRLAPQEFWCARMLKSVPENAELVQQTEKSATYRFEPQPTGSPNDGILEFLTGEIGIDRNSGAVLNFSLSAPEPFRQAVIAKIRSFELRTECEPAPDGRHYAKEFHMNLSGSAAFKGFEDRVVRRVAVIGADSD